MFRDRKDAGQKLGWALEEYKNCDGLVLGIPRGGVEVGYYVAEHLEIPLSLVVVRKLPFPDNPEAGFGAIAEDGSTYFVDRAVERVSPQVSQRIQSQQKRELQRRIEILREGRPLPKIEGRIVVLVDDGVAMGSTMQAAVMLCRSRKAKKVVAASPVAGPSAAMDLARVADQTVILEEPIFFYAVAQAYHNWYDVPDAEVVEIMQKSRQLELHSQHK